jgi:hypothetical protein
MTNHVGAHPGSVDPEHTATPDGVDLFGTVSRRSHLSQDGDAAVTGVPEMAALEPTLSGATVPTHPDVGPPPDGGLEAWLCILGGLLQMFCVFGFCK